MIDIHCHLLPAIDDGPKDMSAALDLARQAVADGVTHSVVTPHIHHGRWENSIPGIHKAVLAFREALSAAEIPLTVGFAGEVRIGPEILSMLPNREIPFLGNRDGKKVMLLEMPHSHILPGTDKIVSWLIKQNVMPMIAHPERNKDVMRKMDTLKPLIELGCLFQVTAGSVVGQFGESAQERAEQLLEMGVVTVLASDAHHVGRRPVNLTAGREAAAAIVGQEEAHKLVYDNPLKIVGGQFVA
ncbi:capsular biosynthesis protein [Aestuariicella hydrocarbonica]|uniref:protein-tyrosine-phosphatase n=1 Tax=Pseudomaricurvus hydrocarbonicus TaxID=1470433 RepID=A0A9E5T4X7_9GAMM|nr:CpsB/CapC family capsule biosynthesis tyrosine phosphatase [Aestuariicella hydrocarbonica]NHO68523.1 capsular biosynthesis protein [Aestuariicella hydrocarbonica]